MGKRRISKYLNVLVAIVVLLVSGHALAANYPLEIIQPRTGLDTKNRFYKTYPGIEYNVKVAVLGGAFPFNYSLTTAPTGMTINSNTGVISWPNPETTGSPYSVAVRVTDQEGTTANVSWTITVTTSGFLFIDGAIGTKSSCNGGSNSAGTISQPFKSIADWYCGSTGAAKDDSTYANYFIYYRTGTYINDAYANNQDANSLQLSGTTKPIVQMGFPDETVNISMSVGRWHFEDNNTNLYLDRLNFINITGPGPIYLWIANGSNVTIRRSSFSNINGGTGSYNQSAIFSESPSPLYGYHYWSITENTFTNLRHAYGILIYQYDKGLIEYNTFDTFSDPTNQLASHAVGLKGGPRMWFVRANTFANIQGFSLDSLYAGGPTPTPSDTRDLELSFNLIKNLSGAGLIINADGYTTGGPVYAFRNTFIGGRVLFYTVTSTNGPFYAYNNVIVNSVTTPADHVECTPMPGCATSSHLIKTNNLSGTSSAGIVDANGNLQGTYLQYLGSRGHQINGNMPSPPQGLTIQ